MSLQKEKSVLIEYKHDGALVMLTINRPQSLNALNRDVLISLEQALLEIRAKTEPRVIIITGAGEKAFVAGADIAAMHDLGSNAIADYIELGQRVMRHIEQFHLPVLAAVNGFALGGGLELALACDCIFAADTAKVGQPEVNLGIIPGFGGTQRLIHRCGIGATKMLCLSGDIITADEALRLHLVDKIVPAAELLAVTEAFAQKIIEKAPRAVSGAKKVILDAVHTSLTAGLRAEVDEFLRLFATKDREEGMKAFLQKRKPQWENA
jgi:enoyl-CoA hydratase